MESEKIPENFKYYWSYMFNLGVTAIYPYADLIGFKQGDQNFFDKSAENDTKELT